MGKVLLAIVMSGLFVFMILCMSLEVKYEPICQQQGYQKWVPFHCKGGK